MKTRFLIIIPIMVGFSISLAFMIDSSRSLYPQSYENTFKNEVETDFLNKIREMGDETNSMTFVVISKQDLFNRHENFCGFAHMKVEEYWYFADTLNNTILSSNVTQDVTPWCENNDDSCYCELREFIGKDRRSYEEFFREHVSTTCPVVPMPENLDGLSFDPKKCEWIETENIFSEPMKNAVFDKGLGHYDYLPINDNPNMMAMEKIQLQDDDSINVEFGQNNYEWSTGYKPIPEFEYNANFQVNDTFVVLCTNIGKDGYADIHPELSEPYLPGLGIVKYLGPITIENEPILLFWHESASIQVDMPCSYPEIIHHSINLWELQESGLPTDSIENALGSNYQN